LSISFSWGQFFHFKAGKQSGFIRYFLSQIIIIKIMNKNSIYQSILDQLQTIPTDQLQYVKSFLNNFTKEIRQKGENKVETMKLAGSWSEMTDEEFEDYMKAVRNTRSEMFVRQIEL